MTKEELNAVELTRELLKDIIIELEDSDFSDLEIDRITKKIRRILEETIIDNEGTTLHESCKQNNNREIIIKKSLFYEYCYRGWFKYIKKNYEDVVIDLSANKEYSKTEQQHILEEVKKNIDKLLDLCDYQDLLNNPDRRKEYNDYMNIQYEAAIAGAEEESLHDFNTDDMKKIIKEEFLDYLMNRGIYKIDKDQYIEDFSPYSPFDLIGTSPEAVKKSIKTADFNNYISVNNDKFKQLFGGVIREIIEEVINEKIKPSALKNDKRNE